MDTMERLVYGAGPKLLHEILGVDWERGYSFQSLMWTTGAAGGWDYMLMGTFGLFCVVGPVVRAALPVTRPAPALVFPFAAVPDLVRAQSREPASSSICTPEFDYISTAIPLQHLRH